MEVRLPACFYPQKHHGFVWSNPNADDSVMIRAVLLRPDFHTILDVAAEFGLERVESEWALLMANRDRPSLSTQLIVERCLTNIRIGFVCVLAVSSSLILIANAFSVKPVVHICTA